MTEEQLKAKLFEAYEAGAEYASDDVEDGFSFSQYMIAEAFNNWWDENYGR